MKKVLILFGGNSYEHEISCRSVNFIIKNIDVNLFDYELVGIDKNNEWFKVDKNNIIDINWKNYIINKIKNIIEYSKQFDKVFSIIHGNSSEDGKLQSLFELNKINYVGCNSYSSLICYDKYLTKLVVGNNVLQVPYVYYSESIDLENIEYPVIIKPCKSGSSIGINVAYDKKQLLEFIKVANNYDNNLIIEKYIKNRRELECAILEKGNELIVSDVGEIITDKWYDYEAKYKNNTDTVISNIDNNIKELVKYNSEKLFKLLRCKDFARIDFLYDVDEDKLYFNEINTIPGFTEISMYPRLINNSGIDYKDLITILLSN